MERHDNDKIPALWFTRDGYGPDELTLQLQPFPAENLIPASLGIRVRLPAPRGVAPPIIFHATSLIDGGFYLHREQAEALHRQIGEWLAATAGEGTSR